MRLHRANLHLLGTHPVQRQHRLLLLALERHKAHPGLRTGGPDRLGIGRIGFVGLDERPNKLGSNQLDLVTQTLQGPTPVVSRTARLHHDQPRFAAGKERAELGSRPALTPDLACR